MHFFQYIILMIMIARSCSSVAAVGWFNESSQGHDSRIQIRMEWKLANICQCFFINLDIYGIFVKRNWLLKIRLANENVYFWIWQANKFDLLIYFMWLFYLIIYLVRCNLKIQICLKRFSEMLFKVIYGF
jgi:hypothetical protein